MIIRKFDSELLGYIALFKKITGFDLHDCFVLSDGTIMFVTEPACAAKAIGKGGHNVKILRDSLRKDLKIVEYSEDAGTLIKNYVYPLIPQDICKEEACFKVTFSNSGERRMLLNNNLKGLKNLKEFVSRYHKDILDIKIP